MLYPAELRARLPLEIAERGSASPSGQAQHILFVRVAEAASSMHPKPRPLRCRRMDRIVIEAHLIEALTHAMDQARQGRSHIERQRQIVRSLQRGGHDNAVAVSLLHTLEEAQALHEQTVRNLEDE